MISKNAFELLEFNKLLQIISETSKSPATKKAILEISPLNNLDEIYRRYALIREIMLMYQRGYPMRIFSFPDLSNLFRKVKPDGSVIEAKELYGFLILFDIIADLLAHINKIKDSTSLHALIAPLTGFPDIAHILRKSIDSEGNILDNASMSLFEIRSKIRKLTAKIKKKLEEFLNDPNFSKFLQDEFITQRSGRWVIPVRMDAKGQIAGVVHDISNTGQTAFIEPIAIIGMSNELENLLAEQKAEEIRILQILTNRIREFIDKIENEYQIVVYFDTLNCISSFAETLQMQIPLLNKDGTIKIFNAKHPLLFLSYKRASYTRDVVPLNVSLGGEKTVMVITGANAGGKTLAIKTVGLLLLMAMSGIPVPADSSSCFPIVDNVLVDIGDEQSIETNLSTFSAHIKNISTIIEKAAEKTVVLIDEIGKGTDPDEGAALACAILNELRIKGCLVFATTHLSSIKVFVYKSEGMVNASMEFDQKTYTPLYKLRIGEPGLSHAFETARKYGLQDNIIDYAKRLLGNNKIEIDNLISELNEKRFEYERLNLEIESIKTELEEKNRLLVKKLQEAENSSKEIISKAYLEASRIISSTKSEINAIMKEAKEKSKESLKKLNEKQIEIEQRISDINKDDNPVPDINILKEGDSVFVKSLGHDAIVAEKNIKLRQLKIRTGGKDIIIPISDVTFSKGKPSKGPAVNLEPSFREEISTSLNIIGMRVDEALSNLEPFINQASLAGLPEIRVIHGIGKMILKKAVSEHLKGHPLIKDFFSAPYGEGGEGVTIIRLI